MEESHQQERERDSFCFYYVYMGWFLFSFLRLLLPLKFRKDRLLSILAYYYNVCWSCLMVWNAFKCGCAVRELSMEGPPYTVISHGQLTLDWWWAGPPCICLYCQVGWVSSLHQHPCEGSCKSATLSLSRKNPAFMAPLSLSSILGFFICRKGHAQI